MPDLYTPDLFSLPYVDDGPAISTACSKEGAAFASERVARQALTILTAYATHGPMNDRETEAITTIKDTTVCARRRDLRLRGLIMPYGKEKAATGVNNTKWGLTTKGAQMADGHEGAVEETTDEQKPVETAPAEQKAQGDGDDGAQTQD